MPMLTVFGSINVDQIFALPHLPATGETVLTSTYRQATGGKGANQAAAAARDGAAIRFIGCVGDDPFGATARAALAELGVDVGDLETVPGTTGVAAIWIDGEGNNQIAVASGANAALGAEALTRRPLARDGFVVLQMETPAAEVAAAIALVRRAGARVILNLAPALPLPRPALEQVDVLVVNEHEAAVLCERLELPLREPAEQASGLAGDLGSTVIVTLGAAGAIGARHDEVLRVEALPVHAVDTTGAGDCFVGVLASALARGASLHAAMQRAAIAGSLACTTVGAMPSFPGRAQIDAALLGAGRSP
jgi:ribokinase